MPSVADLQRQRASMKLRLPDTCTIWKKAPLANGIEGTTYTQQGSANRCRLAPPVTRYPHDNEYGTDYAQTDNTSTERDRQMEIGWDATVREGYKITVTSAATSTVTDYKVESMISDASGEGNILVRVQRFAKTVEP